MKRRHIEWLNIHNSNCDADESVRKTKRQLVKELEEWENTQGGRADTKESKVMRKDFDGNGYAKIHKNDFDDLIAQARMKRATPAASDKQATNGETGSTMQHEGQPHLEPLPVVSGSVPGTKEQTPESILESGVEPQEPHMNHGLPPTNTNGLEYAHTNNSTGSHQPVRTEVSTAAPSEPPLGIQNPLGSPETRRVPMFAMPEEPVKEVDTSAT